MTTIGQLCLLAALVASGYAAFACFLAWRRGHRWLERLGTGAAVAGLLAQTAVGAVLAVALLVNDFRLAYVAQYSSRLLPWYYALSAFWVGQAGSLLLWSWWVGVLAIVYRFWGGNGESGERRAERPGKGKQTPPPAFAAQSPRLLVPLSPCLPLSPLPSPVSPQSLRQPAFAVLMAYQFFLVAIMVFGANPMEPSLAAPSDGAGLVPSLQHPAMLLHPPIVFLGYAGCSIPFALAIAALLAGRLDAGWVRAARPWAFFSWAVLGIGILLGAYWAYEELGWGGYWNWDPVENGSFIPWLAMTAMLHAAIVYRQRGGLKRTTLVLAVATFAACNFAAFLTRSGIFGSLHAFSQSPIGWMFLAVFFLLATVTGALLIRRRAATAPESPLSGLWAKETVATASVFAIVLLATMVFIGTASLPLSQNFFPHTVLLGAGFYNAVLAPVALLLLAAIAAVPLLRWGAPPDAGQLRGLWIAAVAGLAVAGLAWLGGLRHPVTIAVAGLAAATATAIAESLLRDARPSSAGALWLGLPKAFRNRRRTYAGYAMHLALASLALGVAGSSLGTQQHEATLAQGESARWTGRDVRFVRLFQHRLADRLLVQAELEVTAAGAAPYTLQPAQEYYFLQNQWKPTVAVHSTWSGDLYAILHGGEGQERIQLTVVENPLMRWMWLAGWIVLAGAVPWFWPAPKNAARATAEPAVRRGAHSRRRTAA